ncbi:MAG: 3-phosphoshikimate 1-carboxyvinyltransferase [Planctomycetes bacterium]|nr:3-phosphoshikimate 1-carboxyvinyltransferase [Planctomycetota bacterium]
MESDALEKKLPATVTVTPARGKLDYSLDIPGSKSIANRVLLLAGMAAGATVAAGIPDGDDSRAALRCLRDLGIAVDSLGNDSVRIHGRGHGGIRSATLNIGSAGTVGRFLPGLLASMETGEWTLQSTEQLAGRPIQPLLDGLRRWGADISVPDGASFPMRVRATGLRGGDVAVSAAASSQFASGLLMAAPYCRAEAVVRITDVDREERYIDTTAEIMRHFGAAIRTKRVGADVVATVTPGGYVGHDIHVEADLNAALNFLLLPILTGGRGTVTNVSPDTRQPGYKLLDLFRRLGAVVAAGPDGVSVSWSGGTVPGGFDIDMRAMSEMAMSLAVLAVFADGPVTLTNLGHIRNHETDRLAAVSQIMTAFGVRSEEGPDWIRIHPCDRSSLKTPTIDSLNDHRVVMAFSLLGLAANGVTITNADAVSKTFPGFFDKLRQTGAEVLDG